MALDIRKPCLKYEKTYVWFPDLIFLKFGLVLARLVLSQAARGEP